MHLTPIVALVLASLVVGAPMASAEVLNIHRIPWRWPWKRVASPSGMRSRGTAKLPLLSMLTARRSWRCVATAPAYTPSIVHTIKPTPA